jgi:hypothetical protein
LIKIALPLVTALFPVLLKSRRGKTIWRLRDPLIFIKLRDNLQPVNILPDTPQKNFKV